MLVTKITQLFINYYQMKFFLFTFFALLHLLCLHSLAQPNVCVNPPNGYTIGGNFDITIVRDNNVVVDNYLCLTEKVAVNLIGVIDKSTLLKSSIRYIFGVDNATVVQPSMPLSISRSVDGQSSGEFWVMQFGEENGGKKLNCKKLQIDVSDKPTLQLEMSNCDAQTLALNISSDNPVSHFEINWNDGKPIEKVSYQNTPLNVSHSFSQPTPDLIEVTGVYVNSTLNRTCNSKKVSVSTPPLFYIKALETYDFGSSINANLSVQNSRGVNLDLFMSEDNGITYSKKTSFSSIFFPVNGLPKKNLCFKLQYRFGTCLYESDAVCMINPTADNSKSGQIDLQWNSVGRNTSYEVKRTGGVPLQVSNLTTTLFSDKKLDCNGNYLYQVSATYTDVNNNSIKVVSHTVQSKAQFSVNPLPSQALLATILDDGIPQLTIADANDNVDYIIYRSTDGIMFNKVGETKDNKYVDTGNANLTPYCYYVKYVDACNNLSTNSPTVCTILLKNDSEKLSWNKPVESQQVRNISYDVIQLNPIQVLASQAENNFTIIDIPSQKVSYQIKATVTYEINGKTFVLTTTSNPILIDFKTNLYLPTAFSPNDDNINDVLIVKGDFDAIKDFRMLIVNQWGDTIFESNDVYVGWDGNLRSEKVQSGIYTVIITFNDIFGKIQRKTEKILLLR